MAVQSIKQMELTDVWDWLVNQSFVIFRRMFRTASWILYWVQRWFKDFWKTVKERYPDVESQFKEKIPVVSLTRVDQVSGIRSKVYPDTAVYRSERHIIEAAFKVDSRQYNRKVMDKDMIMETQYILESVKFPDPSPFLTVRADGVDVTERVEKWAGPKGDFFRDPVTWGEILGPEVKRITILTSNLEEKIVDRDDVCIDAV